jgi:hypothetical protein
VLHYITHTAERPTERSTARGRFPIMAWLQHFLLRVAQSALASLDLIKRSPDLSLSNLVCIYQLERLSLTCNCLQIGPCFILILGKPCQSEMRRAAD